MFGVVLQIHSLLRWLLLAALVARIGRAGVGLVQKSAYGDLDRRLSLVLVILTDLQVSLGLVVWATSPTVRQAFADPGAAMKNPALRLLFVEHPITMIVGAVLIHVAHAIGKRAPLDRSPNTKVLVLTMIALILMLSRIPW